MSRAAVAAVLALLAAGAAPAQAPARRDPTEPPAAYGAPRAPARDSLEGFRPSHVVTVGGRRYLVWQGRRYAEGDSVQGARIERLDETQVWLRTGDGLRKLPLYPGIDKIPSRTTSGLADATKGRLQ